MHWPVINASRRTIRDSTDCGLNRLWLSATINPPAEKCRSDSALDTWMTKILFAMLDKYGNRVASAPGDTGHELVFVRVSDQR